MMHTGSTRGKCSAPQAGQTRFHPPPVAVVAKLTSDPPACGEKMPAGHALSADDVTCIRRWLAESLTVEEEPPGADTAQENAP